MLSRTSFLRRISSTGTSSISCENCWHSTPRNVLQLQRLSGIRTFPYMFRKRFDHASHFAPLQGPRQRVPPVLLRDLLGLSFIIQCAGFIVITAYIHQTWAGAHSSCGPPFTIRLVAWLLRSLAMIPSFTIPPLKNTPPSSVMTSTSPRLYHLPLAHPLHFLYVCLLHPPADSGTFISIEPWHSCIINT